jgi:hypothetical protein
MLPRFLSGLTAIVALILAVPACAQQGSFESYLQQVAAKARAEGVSEATIATMLGGLTPNDRVMALDRDNLSGGTSAAFPPLAPYLADHNTAARINGGRRVYAQLGSLAADVEARYGVPAPILIAIWGHETSYGAVRGNFDLARSLATLAWEGRRRELFERELIDLLKIADTGVPRATLVGSWAGRSAIRSSCRACTCAWRSTVTATVTATSGPAKPTRCIRSPTTSVTRDGAAASRGQCAHTRRTPLTARRSRPGWCRLSARACTCVTAAG